MRRRQLLKLFAGVAVTALPGFRYPEKRARRIGIVGGGILGSSIAYHLSRRGAAVTLFEKTGPAAGATGNSFGWINATFSKRPYNYYRLNRLGALGYRHLERELAGGLQVKWGGSLRWHAEPGQARLLRERVARHQAWGYPTRLIDAEQFHELEKNVEPGTVIAAAFSEEEGSIDPVMATKTLWEKAKDNGARIESPCEVKELDLRWGELRGVKTTHGDYELDVLVVAAGVDTPKIAAMAGLEVPLKDSPGLLAHSKPMRELIYRVILAPGAHMKQTLDGRIVTGAGFGRNPSTDISRQQGERILAAAERCLAALDAAELDRVTLGWRTLPTDGHPIVGFSEGAPDIYLAVMHSGITMAPLMGRLATMEILDDARVDLLEEFRLSRF
jgi:glycine/D-amino acid oxidase-like deaminating enzyme